jgi:hypothetical protein
MTDTIATPTGVHDGSHPHVVTRAGDSALADLRRRVAGTLHTPADATYAAASTPWTVNVPQHPFAVLEVRDADDVVAAVRWSVEHGIPVTAQPTGHSPGDSLDGILLLRTRALSGIEVDEETRTATVGAGVKAGELLAALEGTGLTFLAGSNPDPTVVGLTLTGGISWFGRAFGIASDSVVAVELVDGLGRLRRVTADSDPELFWALRGGGGDFGIVTRMTIALHPGSQLYGGRLLWPLERMREVLDVFRAETRHAPEALTTWFHTYAFPPLPEVPEPIRGRSFVGIAVTYLGSREPGERLLAPYRAVAGLEMDLVGELPMSALGSVADEPTTPMPGMQRSRLLEEIDDIAADGLVQVLGSGSPLTIFQLRHLGGAFARTPEGAGSPGPVTEAYNLFALGVPAVPQLVPAIAATFGRVSAVTAHVQSGRTLLNFLEVGEDPGRWWSPGTRSRLAAVKASADPLRTIRSNRPVNS